MVWLSVSSCGSVKTSSAGVIDVSYALDRAFTGTLSNRLIIDAPDGTEGRYVFSVSSPDATAAQVAMDTMLPLKSQAIDFTYATEGVHSVDFKIEQANGTPYVFEILTWEYSTTRPDPPIISFSKTATRTLSNHLLVSDSRTPTTSEIFVYGDISTAGQATVENGGFWEDFPITSAGVPIVLSSGDGPKLVHAKFRNLFGNIGDPAIPAEILLKQTPPSSCDAEAVNQTIANNKVNLRLAGTDPYPLRYSILGDIGAQVSQKPFTSGETVEVFVEPTPGNKRIVVYIEDIAGNVCLAKEIILKLDPSFKNEAITVTDHPFWTDDENVTIDVEFDHFTNQEPLQYKITGDVTGPNVNTYLDGNAGIAITLNPTTSGARRIYAQYKDVNGDESYLIAKRLFLKPGVELEDAGGGVKNVKASGISGTTSITINGCTETYDAVAWAPSFTCHPSAANVDVHWLFEDESTLTRSAAVVP